jgi:lysozyme family protein
MRENYARALDVVLKHEGGFANHPRDPGGATMKGVTQATYDAYRRSKGRGTQSVRNIAEAELQEIYRDRYWKVVEGDALPSGVDLAVFDAAVNSGPGRAKTWLRSGLRQTAVDTVKAICAVRMGFLRRLGTWSTFGRGWARRVADIEAKGVSWALTAMPGATPARVQTALQGEATAARQSADQNQRAANASAAVAAPSGAGAAVTPDTVWPWLIALAAIVGVAALILFLKSRQQQERAVAYSVAAQETVP